MPPLEAHWNRIGMHANTAPEASLHSRFIATLEKDPLAQKLREEKEIQRNHGHGKKTGYFFMTI